MSLPPRTSRRPALRAAAAAAATLALCGVCGLPSPARAMSLAEAFAAAQDHDPQYRAAIHERDSMQKNVAIARSGLLPQVNLSYASNDYTGTRSFPGLAEQSVTTRLNYNAPSTQLSVRQPLFNFDAWSRVDQAKAQSRAADATLRARGLDLVDRLVQSYIEVLEARTVLALNEAEVTALEEQLRRTEQRLQRGEGTRTDVAQALAELELTRVRVEEARERMKLGAARLLRLTGRTPAGVDDVPPGFSPQASQPVAYRDWTETALAQSPLLQMRQAVVESARFNVRRNQAGHLPRIDAVASIVRSRNESISNLDQSSNLRSIGVQVQLPLFSGFGVSASVDQAEIEVLRAEEELRNERENLLVEIRRLLQASDAAALRTEALRKAVAASEVALEGATRSQAAGVGTLVDVLAARSRLFSARRDLARAQYDNLQSRGRLLALAGEPMQVLVDRIAAELAVRVAL